MHYYYLSLFDRALEKYPYRRASFNYYYYSVLEVKIIEYFYIRLALLCIHVRPCWQGELSLLPNVVAHL